MPVQEFISIAQKHGFEDIKAPIYNWYDKRLISFLGDKDVQQLIKRNSYIQKKLLITYLEQIDFFNCSRIALVDIGWNGSIQYNIGKVACSRNDYPKIFGLYFGFVGGMPHKYPNSDYIEGVIYDARRQIITESACTEFLELFEESSRSQDPSVIGYQQDAENNIIPIFKSSNLPDRKAEIACNPMIEEIQKGIFSFADNFCKAFIKTDYSFNELKPFAITLIERAIVYPTRREVKMLTQLSHSEDSGENHVINLNNIDLTKSKPYLWSKLLKQSNWRYGSLASIGLNPILPIIRFIDLLKKPERNRL